DRAALNVIAPQFDWTGGFSEGLALVKTGGKFGYIDKTGRLTIRPQFDNAHNFNGGLARVWLAGKQGYIDKSGNFVWKPTK
ncbi:MAG TPA: WG repeat-containing protein, partial [Pyrinomonadaceae bacterium]